MSADTAISARVLHRVVNWVIRLRFTILFLILMVVANTLAGSLTQNLPASALDNWGIGHDSLLSGQIFRLISGTFLSHDPDMFLRQFIFAAAVIGYTERKGGSLRAAFLFFGLDIVGTLLLLACVGWAAGMIDMTATNDVGMSIGGFGLIGVAIARWRGKWLLFLTVLLLIMAKIALDPDLFADGGHMLALMLGFLLGQYVPPIERAASQEAGHAP